MKMKNIIISMLFCLAFAVSGCSSMGESTYGASPTKLASQKDSALKSAKKAKAQTKTLKRSLRKAEKSLKRLDKKLARASKNKDKTKQAADLKKQIKAKKKEIKSLNKDIRRSNLEANRAKDRAKRLQNRYVKAVELEKKRKERAKERIQAALAKKDLKEDSRFGSSKLFSDPSQKFITDYNATNDGGFALPAIPVSKINKKFLRQEVRYFTKHKPGTLVVNTRERHLYLVKSGGKAIRYGIGVGKSGFEWEGEASIAWKKAWPTWTPPEEMIERSPRLAKFSAKNGGQPAGLKNPLGARALYIFKDGKDTLFRVHGTPVWSSIGTAASSGCIRMMNQDVIDLYSRVRNGAKIVVSHS